MKMISKNIPWGKYIRQNYGDEAAKEYRKSYERIWRYQKKSGIKINVSREAAATIIHGDTKLNQAINLSKGITDETELRKINDINRLSEFIQKHGSKQIYNTKETINSVTEKYRNGEITRDAYLEYIKAYKKSPYYLVNGS